MGKFKKQPKYCVVSTRVSNNEKCALEEIARITQKSISMLMREALFIYSPHHEAAQLQGQ